MQACSGFLLRWLYRLRLVRIMSASFWKNRLKKTEEGSRMRGASLLAMESIARDTGSARSSTAFRFAPAMGVITGRGWIAWRTAGRFAMARSVARTDAVLLVRPGAVILKSAMSPRVNANACPIVRERPAAPTGAGGRVRPGAGPARSATSPSGNARVVLRTARIGFAVRIAARGHARPAAEPGRNATR